MGQIAFSGVMEGFLGKRTAAAAGQVSRRVVRPKASPLPLSSVVVPVASSNCAAAPATAETAVAAAATTTTTTAAAKWLLLLLYLNSIAAKKAGSVAPHWFCICP
jgi:hypothetical protein